MVAGLNLARNKFCHNRLHYKKNFKKFYNYLLIILFFSEYFEGELTNTRAYQWLLSLDCSVYARVKIKWINLLVWHHSCTLYSTSVLRLFVGIHTSDVHCSYWSATSTRVCVESRYVHPWDIFTYSSFAKAPGISEKIYEWISNIRVRR